MRPACSTLALAAAFALAADLAVAQEFVPPDRRVPPQAASGVRLGVFGFSTRGGGQVNRDEQAVLGSTVDVAELGTSQVRLRPSFEVGFGRPQKSLHLALEVVYRFTAENSPAVPYLGAGAGYYDDGSVKRVWPTLAMGFELRLQRYMNWLIEYHALDRLGRHRFLVGLATRGGD